MQEEIRLMDLPKILGVKETRDSLSKMLQEATEKGLTYYIKGPKNRDAVLVGIDTFSRLQDSIRELVDELRSERETRRTLEAELREERETRRALENELGTQASGTAKSDYEESRTSIAQGMGALVKRGRNVLIDTWSASPAFGPAFVGTLGEPGATPFTAAATDQSMHEPVVIPTPEGENPIVVEELHIPDNKEQEQAGAYAQLYGSSFIS